MAQTTDAVTFTFLEDGHFLPVAGVVLPEGEYNGRITRQDGKIVEVVLVVPLRVMAALRLKGPNQFSITADYRAGSIREDHDLA